MPLSLYIDTLLNPGHDNQEGVRIEISGKRIISVAVGQVTRREDIILKHSVCAPALINAHDHLKYTWPEHIGKHKEGLLFANSYEWLPTLYREAEQRFLATLSLDDLYWLGVYKNIFSGVTTVVNHARRLPGFVNQFPLRIVTNFAREIFVRSDARAHKMGNGAGAEIRGAKKEGVPFVVHFAEGLDEYTAQELSILEEQGGLFEDAVLVHCINIKTDEEIVRIARAGASVVWCPAANLFLFGRTAPVDELLAAGVNVALGTDSTCTGSETLLEEMRLAANLLGEYWGCDGFTRRVGEAVFKFVTINAARAFSIDSDLGMVGPGKLADLLIFRSDGEDPLRTLMNLTPGQIELLTCDGRCVFGKIRNVAHLPFASLEREVVTVAGEEAMIVGRPSQLLRRVTDRTGHPNLFFPLGRVLFRQEVGLCESV